MDRETRFQALLQVDKTYRRFMIGSSVLLFVGALYFMMQTTYSSMIAVVGLVPTLFFEWKKTVVYLQFNEDWAYRRLIKVNFFSLCFTFFLLFGLVASFLTGHMNRDGFMWAMVIGAPPSILLPFWIDRKLLQLDPEHVTSSMLAKANREQLKRRLDGIND
ncbi:MULTISPECIES: hypothetical protein [unclassified Exiguobacterium]|uniref:hypothetical protein n=1 Tax=unclassified Exiguobacterium TaxID=2644629 RepID=UPI00103C4085|nr:MULTISPECIES: hypothetical protein [unclassified Exiguobacterium]TCI34081.1 hypothetical protein EVJ29_12715 [Exiguobacterium sp. SH4S7]TCI43069.1 hypothetical protein EVJ31_12980 [Exiguobacterium sp. SH5S32]TCI49855.1 hypothetical protein EVJ25_13485 [Exiguobacterium sp. SH1S4]TCI59373.1 hypothetical protein EVJ21_13615 [Exiguobacterium sp. SH0S2]TCI68090.1 hypothetical protein EVJ23_12970 [Exiguobacterium sp. SH1S1]